jgi:hypothetical protein
MGLCRLEAFEIFGNPMDLSIYVARCKSEKFALAITRGPGHNFKPLVDSNDAFLDRESAVQYVEAILTACVEEGMKTVVSEAEIKTCGIFCAGMYGTKENPPVKGAVLDADLIKEIGKKLRETGEAGTYKD